MTPSSVCRKTEGMKRILLSLAAIAAMSGCSAEYVPEIKAHADETWRKSGFEVIGYEGYEWGSLGGTWGGKVWYIVRRNPDNGVTYDGCVTKWGNEYHIYNLKAIDAIKPAN